MRHVDDFTIKEVYQMNIESQIMNAMYYLKQDIERILRNNYVMYNIRKRYGEDD